IFIAHRGFAAAALGLAPCPRSAHPALNGADFVWLLGGANQFTVGYTDRVVIGAWPCQLALLRRSADGVSAGRVFDGHRHGHPAGFVGPACCAVGTSIFGDSGLGVAYVAGDWSASHAGTISDCRSVGGDAVQLSFV